MADIASNGGLPTIPGMGSDPFVKALMANFQGGQQDQSKLQTDLTASQEKIAQAKANQQAALAPNIERQRAEVSAGTPELPQMAPVEKFKPPAIDPKEMQETLSMITALAAIGGALTRQPLTAALNTFSEGVKGYVQGNDQLYQQSLDKFNADIKRASEENSAAMKKYEAAAKKHGSNLQDLQTEYALIAAEHQNPIDLELSNQGRLIDLAKMQEKRRDSFDKVIERVDSIKARHEAAAQAHADRMAAIGGGEGAVPLTPEGARVAEELVKAGKPLPKTRRGERDNAILNSLGAHEEGGSGSGSIVQGQIDYAASKTSQTQLQKMKGATVQAVAQLEYNVRKVKETMAELPSSDISPIVNAIARGEEKWTGDPKYYSLFYYMYATATESARILSGGQASIAQLHQGAADEAKQWANINMTPASFDEVGKAIIDEGKNRIETFDHALSVMQKKPSSTESTKEFRTEEEAASANLSPGTRIKINGVSGTWH